MLKLGLSYLMCFLLFCACSAVNDKYPKSKYSISFIDQLNLSQDKIKDSTLLGGLSSIDHLGGNKYIVISDDRSEYSRARLYEMSIFIDSLGIKDYSFTKTILLKNNEDQYFKKNELDPEAVRYMKHSDSFYFTSEGGRTDKTISPFIREVNREGEFLRELRIPDIFDYYEDKGIRNNGGFESLTFENDSIIWYANELPLKEDGEVPGFSTGKYPVRIVRYDLKNDRMLSQFAYNISSLSRKPIPSTEFYINSVPELLFIGDHTLWVLERSYTTGVGNFVKVFEVNTVGATDVKDEKSLATADYKTVSKKLIIDFSDYNIRIDNIEGMTFGPDFEDGSKSLLFISDDNFNHEQSTQLWLFSVSGLNNHL